MSELSRHQHETLVAVAETALPAGRFIPAARTPTRSTRSSGSSTKLPSQLSFGLKGLLRGLDAAAWLGERRPFVRVKPEKRLALLESWRTRRSDSPPDAARAGQPAQDGALRRSQALQAARLRLRRRHGRAARRSPRTCAIACIAATSSAAISRSSATSSSSAPARAARSSAASSPRPASRSCSSRRATTSTARDFTGRAFEMQQKLYRRGGSTFSVGNVGIPIPLGQTVGGTTTVNSGTCYRTPDRVLARAGSDDLGLDELGPEQHGPYFDRVEAVLGVELRARRAARRQRPRDRARLRRARLHAARSAQAQRAGVRRPGRVLLRLPDRREALDERLVHPARAARRRRAVRGRRR